MRLRFSTARACASCRESCACQPTSTHSPATLGWYRARPSAAIFSGGPKQRTKAVIKPAADALFGSELWDAALEKYASVAHLTVRLFDGDGRSVLDPVHPTPLFRVFEETGYDPGIFDECARRCIRQTEERPAVVV